MSRQTVGDLIQYLADSPDLSEGMSTRQIMDLPIEIRTGHSGDGYTVILSTYVSTTDDGQGIPIMVIDVGQEDDDDS